MSDIPRLFVIDDLGAGHAVSLDAHQVNYLRNVLRFQKGSEVLLFNGRDGEWAANVATLGRQEGVVGCSRQTRAQSGPPDVWLVFSPLKRARTDFAVEKACEMGCRRIQPAFTERSSTRHVRVRRLRARVVEAAEQCGLLGVPAVGKPVQLECLLGDWPGERKILYCDERGEAGPAARVLAGTARGAPWAVLIGPEGGFSPTEASLLTEHPATVPVSLGPRLLRAETAVVASLALWQSFCGDWDPGPPPRRK